MSALVDPVAASRCTGVPLRTIQRWVKLGRITNYGTNRAALVDAGEVQELDDMRDALGGQLPKCRNVA